MVYFRATLCDSLRSPACPSSHPPTLPPTHVVVCCAADTPNVVDHVNGTEHAEGKVKPRDDHKWNPEPLELVPDERVLALLSEGRGGEVARDKEEHAHEVAAARGEARQSEESALVTVL